MMRFLTFTAGSMSLCCVCSHVVVFGLSVRLLWYSYVDAVVAVTVMPVHLFVLHVCMLRECEGARLMAMLMWGMDEVWL